MGHPFNSVEVLSRKLVWGSNVVLPFRAKSLNILKAIDTVTVWVGPIC
jgi:hypothetical protein